jgi:uncharacterized protein DUF4231
MTLFRRLPRLVWSPQNEDIVPSDVQAQHPALAEDFKTLEDELLPHFRELNADALRYQNEFRLDQVMLILGGALAAVLGVLHASLPRTAAAWAGIVEAVLAAALSAVALRARTAGAQQRYFTWRLKAEKMRAEYFLFLGGVGLYADEKERLSHLIRRVAEIKSGEMK